MTNATTLDPRHSPLSDAEKTAYIRRTVLAAGEELRARHPWLRHQSAIGAGIMLLSLTGMLGTAYLYYLDVVAWYLCVPIIAIFASFIHELEHDLIHQMYFRKHPAINSFMLVLCWIARPSTVNPLRRRKLHLHHHKVSGTDSDLEERGITNGSPWGLRRLLMTGDNMLAVYLRPQETLDMVKKFIAAQKPADSKAYKALAWEQRLSYLPLGNLYYLAWHGLIAYYLVANIAAAIGSPLALPAWGSSLLEVLNFLAVTLMLPSFLRTFCIHFISSNMHYYGDVEAGNVMQQTQVLNAWYLLPFQLFCFNFGSTHAIHHFAVREPFYIRQWTASTGHKVMREMGVRFNDMATFRRANRFHMATAPTADSSADAAASY